MFCLGSEVTQQTKLTLTWLKWQTDQVLEASLIWKCLSRHVRGMRVSAWELVWAKRSLWTTRGMLCSESAHSSAYFVQHHYQLSSLYKLSNSFAHSLLAAAARPAVLPPAASCAFTPRHLPAGTVYLWFPRGLLLISRCSCYGWLKKKGRDWNYVWCQSNFCIYIYSQ